MAHILSSEIQPAELLRPEDGILKVIFVKSEDNDADIFTKNTNEELFHKHARKMWKK
jgi:hypothetical protein